MFIDGKLPFPKSNVFWLSQGSSVKQNRMTNGLRRNGFHEIYTSLELHKNVRSSDISALEFHRKRKKISVQTDGIENKIASLTVHLMRIKGKVHIRDHPIAGDLVQMHAASIPAA